MEIIDINDNKPTEEQENNEETKSKVELCSEILESALYEGKLSDILILGYSDELTSFYMNGAVSTNQSALWLLERALYAFKKQVF